MDFYTIAERNKRRTIFLILIFTAILAFLGYVLDFYYFGNRFPYMTVLAIFIGGFQAFIGYVAGDKMVLHSVRARPANPEVLKEKQLINIVEELSLAAGLPEPKVYVMDDPSPNAFATGRDPEHASVCATTGLLEMMNREELQGVMGHELTHIRERDILTMTMVAALAGAIGILAAISRNLMYFGGGRRRRSRDSDSGGSAGLVIFIIYIVLAILAPLIARLLALAVSRAREYAADAGSAELTRNPLALASALRKIAGAPPMKIKNHGVAHLFISEPYKKRINEKDSLWANLWATHPPIQKRIALLEQMAHRYAE